ncbi:hypothetical protein HWV62_14450 [Athelia sp. TMB]|nr:hypothetical protein HWV62_41244 [Athelia sp. TMB]KAF7984406.1 hypothetical protein HWV62_14450 [Athelia sp. TMB]
MVRFKNRWLLVEFIPCAPSTAPARPMSAKHIWAALKQSVIAHFGDVGWGAVGLSLTVKYYSPTTHVCIIRVAREQHRIAWGALTLLSSIEGQKYIPNMVHLSGTLPFFVFAENALMECGGTIKHAQLAAIRHNREVVGRLRARAKTPAAYQDSYEGYLESSTAEIEALQD